MAGGAEQRGVGLTHGVVEGRGVEGRARGDSVRVSVSDSVSVRGACAGGRPLQALERVSPWPCCQTLSYSPDGSRRGCCPDPKAPTSSRRAPTSSPRRGRCLREDGGSFGGPSSRGWSTRRPPSSRAPRAPPRGRRPSGPVTPPCAGGLGGSPRWRAVGDSPPPPRDRPPSSAHSPRCGPCGPSSSAWTKV